MADVKKINGMNINDETSRINIGCTQDTYSNQKTYSVGDIVVYNNTIYKCITAVTAKEEFTVEKWQQICLRDLLIETRKKNIITASFSTHFVKTIAGYEKMIFTSGVKEGDGLSISNGNVVIGKGISKVKVSSNVGNVTTTATKFSSRIMRNNTAITEGIVANPAYYSTIPISPKMINVSEGDVISLEVMGAANDKISWAMTFLTVEAV